MTITAAQVKELREKTGAGMLDAKNALVESGGDMEKAMELLRQKGLATAEKKSGRVAADGLVSALIAPDGKSGVLSEINCETDFVARGEGFQSLAQTLTGHILEQAPADVPALLTQPAATGGTVENYIAEQIGQLKENITVRRFVRYALQGAGRVHSYIHTGGKIGVLVEAQVNSAATADKPEFQQLLKDVAMQIASAAPECVSRQDVPQELIDAETRVELGKEDLANKPEEIRQKIVAARVDKLLSQRVLLEQPFVKDPSQTVAALIQDLSSQLGDTITLTRFTRFVLGEGIEKKESNFAEEVMAQLK